MRFGLWMLTGVLRESARDGDGGGVKIHPLMDPKVIERLVADTINPIFEARDRAAAAEAERKASEAASGPDATLQQRLDHVNSELKKVRAERAADAAKAKEATIREALGKFEYARPSGLEMAYRHVRDGIQEINGELHGPDYSPLSDYLTELLNGDLSPLLASDQTGDGGQRHSDVELDSIKPGANNEAARAEIARLVAEQLAPVGRASAFASKGTKTGVDLDDIKPGSPKLDDAGREIARLIQETKT